MKKRLSNQHLNLVCKSLATYQRFEVDSNLDWKVRNTTGFQQAENVKKLAAQKIDLVLLDELKQVLDQSILTSKVTEKNLVDGIDDVLANEFSEQLTGKTTQQQIRELKNELTEAIEENEDLEEQIASQSSLIEELTARCLKADKPWWKL